MKTDFGDRVELRTNKKKQLRSSWMFLIGEKSWSSARFFVNWPRQKNTPSREKQSSAERYVEL
jgi:hypothetical protein